jgi:hypothetical protein
MLTPVLPPLPLIVRVSNFFPVVGLTTCALSGSARAKTKQDRFHAGGYHDPLPAVVQ